MLRIICEHGTGLSPRMRGNPLLAARSLGVRGSIPAHAGEPCSSVCRLACHAVYPRACGGTLPYDNIYSLDQGLSPRMRGNQLDGLQLDLRGRSIPAPAGEPRDGLGQASQVAVYPRACGGTDGPDLSDAWEQGLSPRLRGNLAPERPEQPRDGSIPAHAGEPPQNTGGYDEQPVYPRACGGTDIGVRRDSGECGLSPRMRGNPTPSKTLPAQLRSIPAHAGEPLGLAVVFQSLAVYPRACGGTVAGRDDDAPTRGLSPRMRGNRALAAYQADDGGSIPAPAGEPTTTRKRPLAGGVYPRACGGTSVRGGPAANVCGLSPRLRGNP